MNSKDISESFICIIWKILLFYLLTRMPYMTHILVHEKKKMKKNIVNKYEKISGHSHH